MSRRLPLAGVRVADLTWVIAGPYGTYLLGRMGAEVIKIEGLDPIDHIRDNPPFADNRRGPNRSGFFNMLNAGKKSVTLQLTDPDHLQIAKEIVATSDVVVESFSYGAMERLGLGYEELRRARPDVILVSCSGFGQTGRDRSLRAFMGTVHAYTGLNSINGYVGGPPKPAGGTLADYATGVMLVFAVLAALRHRRRTGEGQHIDLAMADVVLSTMGPAYVDYFLNGRVATPRGNRSDVACPNNVYRCRGDDAWVAVSAETDGQWSALCVVLDDAELRRPAYADLVGRLGHASEIDARITGWSSARTALEATEALQAAGVPAGPSSSAGDLLEQPQLRARGFFVAPEHPDTGPRDIPSLPWRFGREGTCARAPFVGEHNEEVLRELLGRPQEDIDRLNARRDAALRARPADH